MDVASVDSTSKSLKILRVTEKHMSVPNSITIYIYMYVI